MPNTCAQCKFWSNRAQGAIRTEMAAANITAATIPQPGYCALNAPVQADGKPRWPVTDANDACGQFVQKT